MHGKNTLAAEPGDVVVIHGHAAGEAPRTGVILEILGPDGHEHYRVRWDDEHESLFWLGSDATIRPGTRRRRRSPRSAISVTNGGSADEVPDPEC